MSQLAQGWELDVERGPECLIARLHKPQWDADVAPPLADTLWALLEQHLMQRLVLELDEIELLHSYLIGQLILLGRRLHSHGGMLRICGLSPANLEVLSYARLEGQLPHYANRYEALVGQHPHKPR